VLDPFAVMDLYGTDALRFYLLREVAFGQDGAISPEGFENRYTTELANDYGNLASRSLAMIERYRDGVVPQAEPAADLVSAFDGLEQEVAACLDRTDVSTALEHIWSRIRDLNRYVTERTPWTLAKDPDRAADLDEALYSLAEGLRVVSVLLHPWVPESAAKLLAALGREDLSLEGARLGAGEGGARIGELGQLFPRVEPPAEAA
jgi:methionyl-tRNA synthetase